MRDSGSAGVGRKATVLTTLTVLLTLGTAAQADIRSRQWHLDAMKAEEMWQTSKGEGVTVAVIDTGVEATLPNLRGRVLEGRNFSARPGGAQVDPHNHGTRIAELIAGTGAGEHKAFGLAPGAVILPLRVASGTDSANAAAAAQAFTEDVSAAVRYAADSQARVINISMGTRTSSEQLAEAIRYANARGKLIFASVGNSGDKANEVEYPAALPGVVGVAAVNRAISATEESQRGQQVDLAAPGEDMVAVCANGTDICVSHGTSDATALASASAALVWSAHPDWTANQVLRVLINTAGGPKSGEKRSDTIGYGVVRPRIALQNPGDPGPADVSPLPELAAKPRPTPSRATGGMTRADTDKDSESANGGTVLVAAGVATAIALAAGATVLAVRRRKAAAVPPR
ncbi:type VII secretion-associated serine protease mycosin [Streptomyces sp. NPDC053048]|uniref:type VII secretion-associated serine protease mycosin n=1 Tax=Streptomyces sp. NPDC053048 TaxID=3365694 RepID=UPI0037CFB055